MSCNCIKTIKITSITSSSSSFVLVPSEPITISSAKDLERFRLIICTNLPKVSTLVPITIKTSDLGNIVLYCKLGNYLYRDQIKSRVAYPIVLGKNPTHFQMVCSVDKSCGGTTGCVYYAEVSEVTEALDVSTENSSKNGKK